MRRPWLLPALLSLAAFPARGQGWSDPGLGVGVHASFTKGLDAEAGAAAGGAQVRARLTGGIGVEALLFYRRETHAAGGERLLLVEEVPLQVSAMFFPFFRGPVQPYAVGGIGYYYVHAKGEGANAGYGSHSENKFGFHAGLGVDARLSAKSSLFLDVRQAFPDVDAVKALETGFGAGGSSHFWQASLGANLYF